MHEVTKPSNVQLYSLHEHVDSAYYFQLLPSLAVKSLKWIMGIFTRIFSS